MFAVFIHVTTIPISSYFILQNNCIQFPQNTTLEFWLTSGHWTDEFEQSICEMLGVRFCSYVNSGSSANLNAFMALTEGGDKSYIDANDIKKFIFHTQVQRNKRSLLS